MTSLLNIAGNIPVSAAAVGGQSLRFEDGDSPSFSFTFGTPTNQIKWTMSFWCKRGEIGREHAIYGAANGGGETFFVAFYPDDIEAYISNGRNHVTNAVFRDPSAWYHIVQVFDSANATADDRFITYVNGVRQTTSTNSVALNDTTAWNTSGVTGYFGKNYGAWFGDSRDHFDGYLANVAFIDGTALTPSSFGEYNDTLWKPKPDTYIQALTFGTNGFYLPFKQTTKAEGFSTVTYSGNGGTQGIEGVGFEPDFVWIKNRDTGYQHQVYDSVRGATKKLLASNTDAEATDANGLTSFDSSGFSLGSNVGINESGKKHVAWCWDAGSGSAVSNTDGSITSSVKANTAKGFSITSYVGNGSVATIGHGLSSTPEIIIVKERTSTSGWFVYTSTTGAGSYLFLNGTNASASSSSLWNNTAPTSSVFSVGINNGSNENTQDYIAYCFHSVSGYSSIGSYSGTGASNAINCGFKPAFVMIKATDDVESWVMMDNTRDPNIASITDNLLANSSLAENAVDGDRVEVEFTSTGFTLKSTQSDSINNENGKNYIYMAFADTRDATFFGDTSDNSNNWTPNALNNTDVVPDSPVTGGNFATLNPLAGNTSIALSEGNLKFTASSAAGNKQAGFGMSSGKWYWELYISSISSYQGHGVTTNESYATAYDENYTYSSDGRKWISLTASAYGASYTAGDILGFALDMDAGTFVAYKNGVSQGTLTSGLTGTLFPNVRTDGTGTINANFGQDSSFAGNETPQGNTDDNGVGDFYYTPPSGFLALTTGNLPTPTIDAPDEYFNTVLYTGDGSTSGNIINTVGFDPSFVWIKRRSAVDHHMLYDLVRHSSNPKQALSSSLTYAESSITGDDLDFVTGGFEPKSSNAIINGSGSTYVAWNWLAGNGTVSNTDGSITSTVSANTDAGFSIVKYVGNQVSGSTIGHGLSQAPQITFHKNLDTARNWESYFINPSDGSYDYIYLNMTNGKGDMSISAPSASVITLSGSQDSNKSGDEHIAYCFHSVEGYSKIGTYTGSSDGTFVHTGFAVSWVMAKRTDSTSDWWIWDFTRADNENFANIYANSSYGENTSTSVHEIDLLSNGFKLRDTAYSNVSGGSYIFLAFAEAPFSKSNAR